MSEHKILVLSCPRGGTRYMRHVLRNAKIQVGHEAMKSDGSVTCFYAVEDHWYPGKHYFDDPKLTQRSLFKFEQVWHQTRDPRSVIPSMIAKLQGMIWHWQEKHTGIPGDAQPVELRSMLFWLKWNELIEQNNLITMRYRVEDIDARWPEMRARLSLGEIPLPNVTRDMGTSKAPPMTWGEMEAIDDKVYERVRKLAARYGYED